MAQRRDAVALIALSTGLTLSSCAFQANSPHSEAIHTTVAQPTVVAPAAQAKQLSAAGDESSCVLTTADVHIWCNWIVRYY